MCASLIRSIYVRALGKHYFKSAGQIICRISIKCRIFNKQHFVHLFFIYLDGILLSIIIVNGAYKIYYCFTLGLCLALWAKPHIKVKNIYEDITILFFCTFVFYTPSKKLSI